MLLLCGVGKCLFGNKWCARAIKHVLQNQSVRSSTINLLPVLTETGTNFESVKSFETESRREKGESVCGMMGESWLEVEEREGKGEPVKGIWRL